MAEVLKKGMEAFSIRYKGSELSISMTYGVASCYPGGSISDCINHADTALHYGKKIGKNCVVTFSALNTQCLPADPAAEKSFDT